MTESAFLLVLVAGCLHALWNYWAKVSSGDLVTVWLGLGIAGAVLSIPAALTYEPGSLNPASWRLIAATSGVHVAYFGALSAAYRHGQISVVYPVSRGLGVAISALVAPSLLGDAVGGAGAAGVVCVAVGAGTVGLSGARNAGVFRGIAWAGVVGVSIAAYSLVDKLGATSLGPIPYITSLCWGTFVLMAPLALRSVRSREDFRRRVLPGAKIGLASMLTYVMVLYAMRSSSAPLVLAVRECSVIAGALLGWWKLGEPLGRAKCAGVLAITIGIILVRLA